MKKAAAPPVSRERRLTDLPPPPTEGSINEAIYADSFVSEAPEEATLVQPLARRHSEPPPPVSERRAFATLRPPPPPDPLPRHLPSTMPPPPVALATIPPGPPAPPPSIWRPMMATAAMSATIGAFVSVGLWAMHTTPPPPLQPTILPAAAAPAAKIAPCPIPAGLTASVPALAGTAVSAAVHSPTLGMPAQVSLDALPVEITSPRAVSTPVLRAPATMAAAPRAVARASTSHAAATATHAAANDDEQPSATRAVAAQSEHHAKRSHKSADSDSDSDADDSAVAAPAPPPAPTAGPDRSAIARAIGRAAAAATTCDASPQSGRALITLAPSGNVQSVQLLQPFSDNGVNGCVLRALGRAHVPPFAGEPIKVRKALSW